MSLNDTATLHNVFPNIPLDVIETILESNSGNVDKTFDNLLEMSDPDYQDQPSGANQTRKEPSRNSQKPRVSWSDSPNQSDHTVQGSSYRRSSSQNEDQIKKDAELAQRLAQQEQAQSSTSAPIPPRPVNTSWTNPRQQPPPVFGTPPQPPQSYTSHAYAASIPQPGQNPFNLQELRDQIPMLRSNMVEGSNLAKQKAKELYQQLKTKNMAKLNELTNASSYNQDGSYGRSSTNPFLSSQYSQPKPPTPPRPNPRPQRYSTPPGNSSRRGQFQSDETIARRHSDEAMAQLQADERLARQLADESRQQLQADEEYARRLADEQYQAVQQQQARPNNGRSQDNSTSGPQAINPFQEEAEDELPPPYEAHRRDRPIYDLPQ
ncbi:hypothetical protein NQZ79_g6775 [Umbelopsis isabellina]|nr:hypothetical protein NQZ79_g6775 [Umbelopsis isabellina]